MHQSVKNFNPIQGYLRGNNWFGGHNEKTRTKKPPKKTQRLENSPIKQCRHVMFHPCLKFFTEKTLAVVSTPASEETILWPITLLHSLETLHWCTFSPNSKLALNQPLNLCKHMGSRPQPKNKTLCWLPGLQNQFHFINNNMTTSGMKLPQRQELFSCRQLRNNRPPCPGRSQQQLVGDADGWCE